MKFYVKWGWLLEKRNEDALFTRTILNNFLGKNVNERNGNAQ